MRLPGEPAKGTKSDRSCKSPLIGSEASRPIPVPWPES
jgi:hypothetical protein